MIVPEIAPIARCACWWQNQDHAEQRKEIADRNTLLSVRRRIDGLCE